MDIKRSRSYYGQFMRILVGTGVICQMITLGYSQGDPTGASCMAVLDGVTDGAVFTESCAPLSFPCTGRRVAFVGDCRFYYWCTNWQMLKCPCPTGTAFDIDEGICVREMNADCSCPISIKMSTNSTILSETTTSISSTTDMFASNTTKDDSEDGGASASKKMIYIIVGVLVGIIVLVVVIVIIIICRKRYNLSRMPSEKGSGTDNPNYGIRPYVNSNIIASDGIYSTVNTQPGPGSQQTSLTYSTVVKQSEPPANNANNVRDSTPIRSWSAARDSEVAVMNEWNDPVYANS